MVIGRDQRLFAAHEDVLCHSPFFHAALQGQFLDASPNKRIVLPDEEPEIFSCVLEYLYKGDYTPRLLHDKRRGSWMLEAKAPNVPAPAESWDDIVQKYRTRCPGSFCDNPRWAGCRCFEVRGTALRERERLARDREAEAACNRILDAANRIFAAAHAAHRACLVRCCPSCTAPPPWARNGR